MSEPVAPLVVIVDGIEFPVDVAAVSAADEVMMARDLAIPSRIELFALVDAGTAERRHVVALMAISLRQHGLPVDLPTMLDAVTLTSVVQMRVETTEPEADDAPLERLVSLYMRGAISDTEFDARRAELASV